MTAIDTHAHLDHIEDIAQALKDAADAGVSDIVAVGSDLASNKKNLQIKKQASAPRIHAALGIHPGNIKAEEVDECLQFIRDNRGEAVAIGEIGMDFWYKWVRKDKEKKDEQRDVFRRQLALAREFGLPAIIHTRGTWRECFEITKESGVDRAVFHWYSGPLDVLDDILGRGYFVSASPSLAYSPQSREAISHAPLEQTLIETDSPVFYRYRETEGGFTAGPKDVFRTLEAYAQLKAMDRDKALAIFNANARKIFGLH